MDEQQMKNEAGFTDSCLSDGEKPAGEPKDVYTGEPGSAEEPEPFCSVAEEAICPHCGAPVRAGHRFCPYCGSGLPETSVGSAAASVSERAGKSEDDRAARPEDSRYLSGRGNSHSQPADREAMKERKLPGTICAFLGIIPGLICQLLLEKIGVIATFSSIIGFIGASRAYEKFGRKLSRYGIVVCLIATFLMILLGTHISLASELYEASGEWYAGGEADYRLSFLQCMLISPFTLADSGVRISVLQNLLWSIGFAILGCWHRVKSIWAEQTPAQKR